ncbi:MAG: flagellar biosynthetic protein FliO [Pseudomonadota bacterium]
MTELLTGLFGETLGLIIGGLGSLLIVLGLLWGFLRISKMFNEGGIAGRPQARVGVIEAAAVDTKRRLVLVRRDNAEHLIMIGGPNDLVIEKNINVQNAHRSDTEAHDQNRASAAPPQAPTPSPTPVRVQQPSLPREPALAGSTNPSGPQVSLDDAPDPLKRRDVPEPRL